MTIHSVERLTGPQSMCSDIAYLHQQPFLVSAILSLDLVVVFTLSNEKEQIIKSTVMDLYGGKVTKLKVDPLRPLLKLQGKIGEIAMEVSGCGDHQEKV